MKPTRREFLQTTAFVAAVGETLEASAPAPQFTQHAPLDSFEIARRHAILHDLPTPGFFEGMLLGNGDLGVCIVVRPDALGLHIGKSDCWDIRVSEDVEKLILPFKEILQLWHQASEEAKRQGKPDMLYLERNIPAFREYTQKVSTSYARPWPRPWPCGTVWIHWDPRWVEVRKQALDPSCGSYTLELDCTDFRGHATPVAVECFVEWMSGLISVSATPPAPFLSIDYIPELDTDHASPLSFEGSATTRGASLPPPVIDGNAATDFAEFSCFQYFPALGPTLEMPNPPRSDKDRNFALHGRVTGEWTLEGLAESKRRIELENAQVSAFAHGAPPGVSLRAQRHQPFRLDIKVATPRDILLERLERAASRAGNTNAWIVIPQDHAYSPADLDTPAYARREIARLAASTIEQLRTQSEDSWRNFWSRSAVQLDDPELERLWYHNQYFLACCLREHKTAPGLFGNWSAGRIGTAWHSDYHMDYNEAQVYWGVFSSNHVDQHLPYAELCQNLLPMAEKYAKDKYGLPGAYFLNSYFPVPSQVVPDASPPWEYQICETPWTVQSLWWQYLYTVDVEYLRHVYPILLAATRFIAAFLTQGEDGKFHVIPTVSSENWGFTVDYRLNRDCILDLALIQFLLDAAMEASTILDQDADDRVRWKEIREHLAPYPQATGPYGDVWVDVADAPVEWIYNVPLTLAPIFPAEQVGIGRGEEYLEIARRTARVVRLEGGNDLVYQPLIRARLGMLDLAWFKRQVNYCLLPDGIANDRVRQTGGRYNDLTDFDFMMRMGVWTENLGLPAVINECLMQSYTGTLRLFPNTLNLGPVRFQSLRAAGAFLVDSGFDGTKVTHLSVVSEKGKTLRLANPWPGSSLRVTRQRDGQPVAVKIENGIAVVDSEAGERYHIEPLL